MYTSRREVHRVKGERQRSTMAELGWIQTYALLMPLLHITAADTPHSVSVSRVGDDVVLPCESMIKHKRTCDSSTWIYAGSGTKATVEVVKLGQINKQSKSGSDRLSLTENCGLVLKNVTVDDAGLYTCRQYIGEREQDGENSVDLSVVTMAAHTGCEEVTLSCSVSTVRGCEHTVMWLFANEYIRDVKTSQSDCSANVSFTSSYFNHWDEKFKLFQCQVKVGHKVQLFTFRHQVDSSCERTGWWYVTVAVAIAAIMISAVALLRLKKKKASKTQMHDNIVTADDPEGGVSYASIRFPKKSSSRAQVQGEGDAVVYSGVNAEASTDPNNVYAAINYK